MASSVEAIYAEAAAAGARPDPVLTVSEWADRYRMLSTRSSSEPGAWRTDRTPYLRAIMDALSAHSRWERVVFQKGSQVGGTEVGNNWIGYTVHQAPCPMMLVQPTTDMAKRNSRQRIEPLFEESPQLRTLISAPRSRDSSNTVLLKEFAGGLLVMVGANSAAGLRSMAAKHLFLDEVDAYPTDVGDEGDPVNLAVARTRTFAKRKIFACSTPSVSGMSKIERLFAESDQSYYHVPCPHCLEMQVLRFAQLRWPKGHPEAVVYICEACQAGIPNHAKNWMLPRGEWRESAAGDGRTKGFHLSSLYSPVGWFDWEAVARQYEQAGRDRQLQQVFHNTVLGDTFSELTEQLSHERLYERRETYTIGKVPRGGMILTAGVDVQARRLELEIVAWGRRRESWSIDYRILDGDTSQREVWDALKLLLDEEFMTAYGLPVTISKVAVDSGYNTMRVYDWARELGSQKVMVVKGEVRAASLVGAPSPIEVGPQGNKIRYGIRLWPINTSIAKEELYRWLRQPMPNIEAGEAYSSGYCHFPQYSQEYFEQICAEQLVTKIVRGVNKTEWIKLRDRNEALDCRLYARAAFASLRTELWQDVRWDELEMMLTARRPDADPPPRLRERAQFRPVVAEDPYL